MGNTLNLQESKARKMDGPGMRLQHKQAFLSSLHVEITLCRPKRPEIFGLGKGVAESILRGRQLSSSYSIPIPAMLLRAPLARPFGQSFFVLPMFADRTLSNSRGRI